ncbi:MAG TPA: J domain-containing protein [Acidimicrobiales bacterium]|nr:J domain-containing protein [Acidimicrobiales bacterium]
MDTAEAWRRLGLEPGAPWVEVRAAYRRLMRAHHPDVAGGDAATTARTAGIIEAYAVLRARRGSDPYTPPAPPEPAPDPLSYQVVGNDTVALGAPVEEAFLTVLEVGHQIGEVTYIDREASLLESIVQLEGGPVCSLVVTFQGRANGTTEAFCTLEPLGVGPSPPATAAVEVVTERLRAAGWRPLP